MKTISIEIDCGNGLCGNCKYNDSDVYCQQFDSDILGGERIPTCIEAEQLHKDAVTASEYLANTNESVSWFDASQAAERILKGGGG